jgi:hypothetical protein
MSFLSPDTRFEVISGARDPSMFRSDCYINSECYKALMNTESEMLVANDRLYILFQLVTAVYARGFTDQGTTTVNYLITNVK